MNDWLIVEAARALLALCDDEDMPMFNAEGLEELRQAVEELPNRVLH